jgi:hypothetical protein
MRAARRRPGAAPLAGAEGDARPASRTWPSDATEGRRAAGSPTGTAYGHRETEDPRDPADRGERGVANLATFDPAKARRRDAGPSGHRSLAETQGDPGVPQLGCDRRVDPACILAAEVDGSLPNRHGPNDGCVRLRATCRPLAGCASGRPQLECRQCEGSPLSRPVAQPRGARVGQAAGARVRARCRRYGAQVSRWAARVIWDGACWPLGGSGA